jgi:heme/copper-type cytochrome/quinol oxidase subunit 2
MRDTRSRVFPVAGVLVAVSLAGGLSLGLIGRASAQEVPGLKRQVVVTARKYAFAPVRIEVDQDDLVVVTLKSDDIAHSFTIDAYRIAKRVSGGHSVTFEFRADQPGTFPIYCNLKQDDGCRQMRGELVVKPHK